MTIRTRLTIWYGLALLAILTLGGSIVWMQVGRDARSSLNEALHLHATNLVQDLERDARAEIHVEDPSRPGVFAIVFDASGAVVNRTPNAPDLPNSLPPGASDVSARSMSYAVWVAPRDDGGTVVAGRTLADFERARRLLLQNLVLAAMVTGIVALVGGWWLAGRAIAPVSMLASALEGVDVGGLARRVPEPNPPGEVGRLARAINAMLDRIDEGMRRQRAFVAAASHDLRTPIAALRTELELADRGRPTRESLLAAVRAAHGDAVRLGELANELLELAEAEPGGRPLTRTRASVREVLETGVRDLHRAASGVAIDVRVQAPAVEVDVDRHRLEQAVRNLVANALRAAPAGTAVEVVATVRPSENGTSATRRDLLEVTVRDRGPGVAPDIREALFLPFARSDGHTEGSGLGLATAAAAVRSHGGEIGYRDAPGGGAEFWFRIPA